VRNNTVPLARQTGMSAANFAARGRCIEAQP
jgi:hypothetical protein